MFGDDYEVIRIPSLPDLENTLAHRALARRKEHRGRISHREEHDAGNGHQDGGLYPRTPGVRHQLWSGNQRIRRSLAALASSGRLTGVVTGAPWSSSGCVSASPTARFIAAPSASIVSLDSVSVGSTISASSTTRGK